MSKAQDPFASTSDPNLYVARAATEAAIDSLASAAWHGDGVAALLGPAGLGKSLLLRVLARRAEDALHCIHVPVPTLDPEGITLWAASRLPGGRRLGGSDALLEVARERPLLLLIEDAELLPEDSARAVAELHRASQGAIRAVLAVNAEELPETLESGFAPEIQVVALRDPMSRDEVVEYVTRRLAAAGVPQSVAERFDGAAIAKLHEISEGNPAKLNIAARTHMPVAARSLAPTLPDAGLWQDPFPLATDRASATLPPVNTGPGKRSRWVWGLSRAIAASAATFGVGLLLGLWLRGGESVESESLALELPLQSEAKAIPGEPAQAPEPTSLASGETSLRVEAPNANVTAIESAPSREHVRAEPVAQIERPPAVAASARVRDIVVLPVAEAVELAESEPIYVGEGGQGAEQDVVRGRSGEFAAEASSDEVPAQSPVVPRPAMPTESDLGTEPASIARNEAVAAPRLPLFAPELPRELTADLRLVSEPPAVIEIDGRSFGPTPIRIPGLRPGVHRLVAHFRTGETMTRELILSSGESELSLRGPLRRVPRLSGGPASEMDPTQPIPGSDASVLNTP